MRRRPLHLIGIVIQPDDLAARENRHLARGFPHSAADVEDFHRSVYPDAVGEVVLVAGKGLQERFPRGETAEVEGLRPGFFVEVGGEVVVAGFQEGGRVVSDGYGRNR